MFIKTLFDFKKATFRDLSAAIGTKIFFNSQDFKVIIDLNELVSMAVKQYLDDKDKLVLTNYEFTSAVYNTVSYLRNFFFKNFSKSYFFLYGNLEAPEITELCSRSEDAVKLKEYFRSELNMASMIGKYVPGVYFIGVKKPDFDNRVLPIIIDGLGEGDNAFYNIIVSNRKISSCFIEVLKHKTLVLSMNGINSKVHDFEEYIQAVRTFGSIEDFFSYMGGDGRKKAVKRKSLNTVLDPLKFSLKNDKDSIDEAVYTENHIYFNLKSVVSKTMDINIPSLIKSQIIDLNDMDTLERINKETFSVYPLNIPQLTLGF